MTEAQDQALSKILDAVTISNGVMLIEGIGVSESSRYWLIILSELMDDSVFVSRMNKLRYRFNSPKSMFFGDDFNKVIRSLKERNVVSFDVFKQDVFRLLDNIESTTKVRKFEVYFPINTTFEFAVGQIIIGDVKIEFLNYDSVKTEINDDILKKMNFNEKFTPSKYSYLKVTLWARNENYCVELANKYAGFVIGLLGFLDNLYSDPITFIGPIKEITSLKFNYLFVFDSSGKKEYYYFNTRSDDKKIYFFSKEKIKVLNEMIILFNVAKKSVQSTIILSISNFYEGLIEKDLNVAFLRFWISLEIITLKGRVNTHKEIIKRLKGSILNLTKLEECKIDRMYSLRNNFVHTGDAQISQFDRNLLKVYAGVMLNFFIFELSKFELNQIDLIYQFVQKNSDQLEEVKSLADIVIKLKNLKKE